MIGSYTINERSSEFMGEIVNRTDDGIVVATFPETMDEKAAKQFVQELKQELTTYHRKSRVLTDVSRMKGNPSKKEKAIVANGIKENKAYIEKSAVCGLNATKRLAAWFIFMMSKRSDIKLFSSKEDALKYLRS